MNNQRKEQDSRQKSDRLILFLRIAIVNAIAIGNALNTTRVVQSSSQWKFDLEDMKHAEIAPAPSGRVIVFSVVSVFPSFWHVGFA